MKAKAKYRHELKYEITYGEYLLLEVRLASVMQRDRHAGADGTYRISSLYFDNCYDKALLEKINGVDVRDKYRIRYYNDDFSYIVLEKKSKRNSLCLKTSCRITEDECKSILRGDNKWMAKSARPLLREFYALQITQLMRPKTIVSYTRQALVFMPGNTRVTFDTDIRSSLFKTDPFDLNRPLMEALPGGKVILEIKYDEFLPEIIRTLVQSGAPRVQSFSKYAACRQFG